MKTKNVMFGKIDNFTVNAYVIDCRPNLMISSGEMSSLNLVVNLGGLETIKQLRDTMNLLIAEAQRSS